MSKISSFIHQVERYNHILEQSGAPMMIVPGAVEIKALPLSDSFWDVGQLSHPNELWAVDQPTKDGIQAYLKKRRAEEELGRVARESRQLMNWGILTQEKLIELQKSVTGSSQWISFCFKRMLFD